MKNFRSISRFLKPFRKPLIVAVLLTGSLTLIGMLPPLLMRRLINDVAKEGNWGIFELVIGLMIAVPLLRTLVNVTNSLVLRKVDLGIIANTRKELFAHLMRLSMDYFDRVAPGALVQRIMPDVANISSVVTGGIIMLFTDIVAVAFAVVVMLKLNMPLSALTFFLLPLYYLNYRYFCKRIRSNAAVMRSSMDHISSSLQERLSAHELIQSYGQERAQATHFTSLAKQVMDASVKGSAYSISYNQVTAFINKIGNSLIYCGGCYLFLKGQMEYGDVVAFCAYASQLLGPVVRLADVSNQISQVGVSVERIQEIIDEEPTIQSKPDSLVVPSLAGEIHMDGVSLTMDGDEVVRDVHIKIPSAEHVAVAGEAGAGRSALAYLLRRFYDPTNGSITVNGNDIRDLDLKSYREKVAMILPESAVFDGTIRFNLCYGRPDATEEEMIEVSKAIGFHDFVESLKNGYDTVLGSGGMRLSAGVKQQIGIARALISKPEILIMDEATAVFDPESAERIQSAAQEFMRGKTCILIVNRILLARTSDQVIVMDTGRVVENGSHDDLLATSDSLYRRLFADQYGEDSLPQLEGGAS